MNTFFTLSNRYFVHLISICLAAICSFQGSAFERNRFIISILTFIIIAINATITEVEYKQKKFNRSWKSITIFVFLLLSLFFSVYPFSTHNPYNIFSIEFIKSLTLISIPSLLFYINYNQAYQEKFIIYAPFSFLLLSNIYFILLDYSPLEPSDHSRHFSNILTLYDTLTSNSSNKFFDVILYYDFYQPLVYFLALPFVFLFGKSYTSAAMSITLLWLPIGYFSTYFFAKKYLRLSTILASTLTFTLFGSVMATSMSKQLMLDFPCLVIVCWYNYSLAKSGYLKFTKYSFYAGLIFGLGILTKTNFLMLGLVPFAFAIVRVFIKIFKSKSTVPVSKAILNIVMHVVAIIISGGFWYLINNSDLEYDLDAVTTQAGMNEGDPYPYSLQSFITYPKHYIYYFSPILIFILSLAYLYSLNKNFRNRFYTYLALISLLVAYLIGTITWNKDARTLLPSIFYMYPAFIGFANLKNKRLQLTLVSLVLLVTFVFNFTFIFEDPLRIIDKLTKPPYTIHSKPLHPSVSDSNEEYFFYQKFMTEVYGKDTSVFNSTIMSDNMPYYMNKVYKNIYKADDLCHVSDKFKSTDYKLVMWRDSYFRDYYLFAFMVDTSYLYINKINQYAKIGGNIKIFIHDGVLNSSEIDLPSDNNELKIPINSKSPSVSFALKITHSNPSSRWFRFMLKFTGDLQYSRWNVPMYHYSAPNNEQVYKMGKPFVLNVKEK